MLDYYGSIVRTHGEIHSDLSKSCLKDVYCKELLDEVLGDKEYSVSGYMVFFRKTIIEEYHLIYEKRLSLNDKKLTSYYGLLEQLPGDIIYKILDTLYLNNNIDDNK